MSNLSKFLTAFGFAAAIMGLGACSTNPATGQQSFTAFMSKEKEAEIGAEEHPKILKELGGAYDAIEVGAYIARIGSQLAALSELPNIQWRFTVLNDHRVNAFALPGGYIYITRGLLALAENESEVAGVLAHEIGHVTARHSAQRYSSAMAANIGMTVLGVLGSAAGVPSGVGKMASFGAQAALQQYSQGQELEADMLGVRYMTRAGYSPDGMTSFFKKLRVHRDLEAREQGRNSVSHNIMSTHPRTEDRIRQAIKLAKERTVKNPKVRRAAYLKAIDGLIFGDDPSQGVRRGRSFMHPDLRIAFAVPPRFVMFNSPRKVVAFGPEMSRIIFDMADPKEAKRVQSLTNYVGVAWGRHLNDLQRAERLEINGLQGATVQGRVSGQDGLRDVRLVVMRGDREKIFRFAFITKPSETRRLSIELRRTTFSFRRLSAKEAADIRPLRVRITTAKRDDTAASLAKRYPFERFQKEWFQLLNNMRLGDKIRPGQKIKMVTD